MDDYFFWLSCTLGACLVSYLCVVEYGWGKFFYMFFCPSVLLLTFLYSNSCCASGLAGSRSYFTPDVVLTERSDVVLYTLSADRLRLDDFLRVLYGKGRFSYSLESGVESVLVTYFVRAEPLDKVLRAVALASHLRLKREGDTYIFMRDEPYMVTYDVGFLGLERGYASSFSSSSVGGDILQRSGSSQSGRDGVLVSDVRGQLWSNLVSSLQGLLLPSSKMLPSDYAVLSVAAASSVSAPAAVSAPVASRGVSSGVYPMRDLGQVSVVARWYQHESVMEQIERYRIASLRVVMVEVDVAEVTLSSEYQQGVNWSALSVAGSGLGLGLSAVGVVQGNGVASVASISYSGSNVNALFKLLEGYGKVKVVSHPKLALSNGGVAVLRVVDNLVYFTVTSQSVQSQVLNQVSTSSSSSIQPVGFSMFVSAQISSDGLVSLCLHPSVTRLIGYVSDPNPSLQGVVSQIPQVQTREIDTVMSVRSGQSTVIGGLMQDDKQDYASGFPGVGSRIFGWLLGVSQNTTQKTELVLVLKATVL